MSKFEVGDEVYVPSRLLPQPDQRPFALTRTGVTGLNDRSIRVAIADDDGNDVVCSSKLAHPRNLGVTIVRIGDFVSEQNSLDPLAKACLHYLRLLLEPDVVRYFAVRTRAEIEAVWSDREALTSHLLLLGHGSSDPTTGDFLGVKLMDEPNPLLGVDFASMLGGAAASTSKKTVLSAICQTGRSEFGGQVSANDMTSDFFGPFQSVHAGSASLFIQAFFSAHLLNGKGVVASHRLAGIATGPGLSFRHWRKGEMKKVGG